MILALVRSAAAETVDVTTFAAPSGWKRAEREYSVEYTNANKQAAASLTVHHSQPAAGDAKANFDTAWKQIVVAAFKDLPAPTMAPAATRGGWQIVTGSTKYAFQGNAARTTILTATRDTSYVIVVATTVGTQFEKEMDKVLASMKFAEAKLAKATVELGGAWGF